MPADPAAPAEPADAADAADAAGAARARLVWHCRRGTRELELLLQRWLEQCYEGCDGSQRALFEALLELPDPLLADYLLGGVRPAQPRLAVLVQAIRGLASASRATGAAPASDGARGRL